jgi:hypothetical protein
VLQRGIVGLIEDRPALIALDVGGVKAAPLIALQ